jgi:hypothetical protein
MLIYPFSNSSPSDSQGVQLQLTDQLKKATLDLDQSRFIIRSRDQEMLESKATAERQSRDLDLLLRERQHLNDKVSSLMEQVQALEASIAVQKEAESAGKWATVVF